MDIRKIKLPLPYNARYRKDCLHCEYNDCKYSNYSKQCLNCSNIKDTCNCLQVSTIGLDMCPYFKRKKGECEIH